MYDVLSFIIIDPFRTSLHSFLFFSLFHQKKKECLSNHEDCRIPVQESNLQCIFPHNFVGEADSFLKNPIAPSHQHTRNMHITRGYPADWDDLELYPFWFFRGDESLVLALKLIFNLNFLPRLEFEGDDLSGNYFAMAESESLFFLGRCGPPRFGKVLIIFFQERDRGPDPFWMLQKFREALPSLVKPAQE